MLTVTDSEGADLARGWTSHEIPGTKEQINTDYKTGGAPAYCCWSNWRKSQQRERRASAENLMSVSSAPSVVVGLTTSNFIFLQNGVCFLQCEYSNQSVEQNNQTNTSQKMWSPSESSQTLVWSCWWERLSLIWIMSVLYLQRMHRPGPCYSNPVTCGEIHGWWGTDFISQI